MRFLSLLLVSSLFWPTLALALPLIPSADQTAMAKASLEEARKKDFPAMEKNLQQLGSHPFEAYFDYHRMLKALPDVEPKAIQAYQQQYADTPLANSLQRVAINAYGKAQRWNAFLALQSTPPTDNTAKCYYWRAQYANSPEKALKAVPDLWLTGISMPNACDPLFAKAREAGIIDEALVWDRFLLAMEARSTGLMRYLTARLQGARQQQAQFGQDLINRPEKVLTLPNTWPEPLKDSYKKTALLVQAQKDTDKAIELLQQLTTPPAAMGKKARLEAEHKIVWYVLIRDKTEHLPWADQWLQQHADDELIQQRVRLAIRQQDWQRVVTYIRRFDESKRNDPRWQYWLARALQETGQKKLAQQTFEKAAQRRTFWAFLAADEVKQPYALNNQTPPSVAQPPKNERLARIHWLMAMGETGLARSEWLHWMRQEPNVAPALANYALQQGWPGFTVDAAIQMKDANTLNWRFPLAFADDFQQAGKSAKVDPYLLMAIARRESAYQHHVVSHAGAVGLMQVMPGTARQIANWRQEAAPSQAQLKQPKRSIELGSTYVQRMLERFHNNRLLALAAYNAGPHRVDAWLDNRDMPFDVWVESIPFYETREYVQAVLTYRVLLEAQAQGNQKPKQSLLTKTEKKVRYNSALLK